MELSVWQAPCVSRGENLERARIERNLSQAELAGLAHYDGEQLGKLERDEVKAHGKTWKKLADALEVDVKVLLSDTPGPQPDAKLAEFARKEARVTGGSVQFEGKTPPTTEGAHNPPSTKEGYGMQTTITAAEMQMLGAVRRLRGRIHDDFIDTVTEMAKQVRKARPKPRRLVHSP